MPFVKEEVSTEIQTSASEVAPEKSNGVHQLPIRVAEVDYKRIKLSLSEKKMSFQKFVNACVDCYLSEDEGMLKAISDWRARSTLHRKTLDRKIFSKNEVDKIMEQIETDPLKADE